MMVFVILPIDYHCTFPMSKGGECKYASFRMIDATFVAWEMFRSIANNDNRRLGRG